MQDVIGGSSIVHIQYPFEAWGNSPFPGVLALVVKRISQVKGPIRVVTTFHEWHGMHWMRRLSVFPLAYFSDMLIFVSKRERDAYGKSLIGRLRGNRQLRHIIPISSNVNVPVIDRASVATERATILGGQSGRREILLGFFGFIYDWKQPYKLLSIIKELRDDGINAKLLICGDFPDGHEDQRAKFWLTVAELGIEHCVIHKGYVEDEVSLAHMLAACDAHLYLYKDGLSSRRGSFWYSMKLGVRVICTPPRYSGEFDGLIDLDKLVDAGDIRFVEPNSSIEDLVSVAKNLADFRIPTKASAEPPDWNMIADLHHVAYENLLEKDAAIK